MSQTKTESTMEPQHMKSPHERCCIVTGANRGIGRAIIERIMAQDMPFETIFQKNEDQLHLVFTTRHKEDSQDLMNYFKEQQESVKGNPIFNNPIVLHHLTLDIEDEKSVHNFVNSLKNDLKLDHVDIMINNAGWCANDPDLDQEMAKKTLSVNFSGTKRAAEAVLPLMKKKTGQKTDSRLLIVSSDVGIWQIEKSEKIKNLVEKEDLTLHDLEKAITEFCKHAHSKDELQKSGWGDNTYGFSKACQMCLVKMWAKQHQKDGIMVNCCHPGYVQTDMTKQHGPLTPYEGALNVLYPAFAKNIEGETGKFFKNQKEQPMIP